MLVTDKQYYMEKALIEKLDLMIERMNGTDDNVVLIDGDEGQGKTNMEFGIAYYIAHKTGRLWDLKTNLYFDLDKLIKYASETNQQILLWDEGALGGLASEWWQKNQIKFLKLLMVCRKKKHFFVICIPKFFKLNEYLVVDRSIALIHVYSRSNIHKGRFFYYTKAKKEELYNEWKSNHKKWYNKFKSCHGTFPNIEGLLFDFKEYDAMKEQAILSLGTIEKVSKSAEKYKQKLDDLRYKFATSGLASPDILAQIMGINRVTLYEWKRLRQNEAFSIRNKVGSSNLPTDTVNNGLNGNDYPLDGEIRAIIGQETSQNAIKKADTELTAGQINKLVKN